MEMRNSENLRKEHELVRNGVAFYDFTLETLEVSGKDAREFLDYVFVNDVAKMNEGDALYTSMLDEEGYTLDDLIMFCRGADMFWITTGMIDQMKEWFSRQVGDRAVTINDITDEKGIYAVQGPESKNMLNRILKDNLDDLATFTFKDTTTESGIEVMAARTGFTGELGYELHLNPEDMEQMADELKAKGIDEIAAEEVTLGSLPVEKGFIADGEFIGANPVEIGLGWTVNCDKDFIGRERTCAYKNDGPPRHLLGFSVDEDGVDIEKGDIVEAGGEEVGKVTNYTYGFSVETYIGYALVDSKVQKGDEITIKTANGEVQATLQDKVFHAASKTAEMQ